ncbi:hypothetical protein HJC23_013488 [Cyclotella cryptica]|uniref:SP-RING-type domain-containing protein n=1 Tax=Cyclotella cryptica TaxID=29204 RepID=A0ABD3QD08_9STRA
MPPRHSTSRSGSASALLAATRAIESEDQYRRNVNKLQARTLILADHLIPGDGLETTLDANDDDDVKEFLLNCRERLKEIAVGNAKRMYEIDYFVEAVKEVKGDVMRRLQQAANVEGEDAVDYEAAIHQTIERVRERGENDRIRVPVEQHPMSIELRTRLGEKIKSSEDDDDLEIVNRSDDVHALKCPITGMLYEDPVKNKVCHHTYSRQGLQQLIKNKKTTCPVAGCSNRTLSLQQVEDDEVMTMKVTRFKKREEQEKKKRKLEEEDMDDGEGGFTVIQ